MNKQLLSKFTNCITKYQNRIKYQRMFTFLALIVILGTSYALMKPAITMNEELICEKEEHTHTDECYTESFICENTEENLNNASCYKKVLTCEKEEHTHTDDCYGTEEDKKDLAYLISVIDSIPTVDEMNNHIEELPFEEKDVYRSEVINNVSNAYNYYKKLKEKVKLKITNIDKILEYVDKGLVEEKNNTSSLSLLDSYEMYGINNLAENNSNDVTIVPYVSTKDFIELNLYDYGSNINTNYNSNNKYPGFQWNGGAYLKSTYNRHIIDYIDFGNSMITDFTYGSSYYTDNRRSPNAQMIALKGGAINELDISNYGVTNRPIGMSLNSSITDNSHDVLSRTLGNDGYPALADGTSLSYLFNSDIYANKLNTTSIDGLFQQNDITGEYFYNSRENHAQYNNNHFTLYNEIITPNFITYPFGNFLPLNNITSKDDATQVNTIQIGNYGQDIINNLIYSSDYSSNPTKQQLVDMLAKYRSSLQSVSGNAWNTWTAKDAINDYFTVTNGDHPTDDTSPITNALLSKMYNIDWDVETNFFFGMEMKMNFMQPKGGMTGNDTNNDGIPDYPMKFYFTGDDDVWVYIDDVLFLDLSGIHRHVGGEIDFVNGKVYYYYLDTANTGDVSETPYQTYTFREILNAVGKSTDGLNSNGTFKDYTTHSFKFYYMERGSGSSVCRLNFNFPLLRQNSINVSKELTGTDDAFLGNPDFKFQILKATDTGEKTNELFIDVGTEYTIYDEFGNKLGVGTTDQNGVFKLKAGQRVEFANIKENAGKYYVRELLDDINQYVDGEITVSGESTTRSGNVTIGSDTFTGVDSPIKDMSDGSTNFSFNNKIDINKYGSLKIKKVLKGPNENDTSKEFKIKVTLDGIPLPIGTEYTIESTNESKTVIENGIIIISPTQTVVIKNILAGSSYEVVEVMSNINGYTIKYENNGIITDDGVSGKIIAEDSINIIVTNTENSADVVIPITKTLVNPDDNTHSYQFELTEIPISNINIDSNGNIVISDEEDNEVNPFGLNTAFLPIDPKIQNIEKESSSIITVNSNNSSVTERLFTLSYSQPDYASGITKRYYKIIEIDSNEEFTKYDNTIYVVEVSITNEDIFKAEITGVWKNGQSVSVDTNIEFINELLSNLTISKIVESGSTSGEFEFEIKLEHKDNTPLVKEFNYIKYQTNDKDNTSTTGMIEFDINGKANINLKHNESITIKNIPTGVKYIITELTTDGYVVKHEVDSGVIELGSEATSYLNKGDNLVKFKNASGYELPATGSSGMSILIIIGSLLLIVPIIYIGYMFYKRGKEGELTS